jgi:uridine phosphorylase
VKQYSAAYLSGNFPKVKSLTSHRCLIALGHKQLASRVGAIGAVGGKLKPGSIKITSISPTNATVTAKYLVPKLQSLTEHWVHAKNWRDDDC